MANVLTAFKANRTKIWVGAVTLLLVFYLVVSFQRSVLLMTDPNLTAKAIGVAYLVLPLVGAWALVILGLAVWQDALTVLAEQLGIVSAPNALFFVALAFVLLLLLHFSAAMSRLADQSKVLAQRQALLEQRLGEVERERALAAGEDPRGLEPLLRTDR